MQRMRRMLMALILSAGLVGCMPNTGQTTSEYDPMTGEKVYDGSVGWKFGENREPSLDSVRPDMPVPGEK